MIIERTVTVVVEAMEGPGCCRRWLFVVQPAQPTQFANPAERHRPIIR
jgi:hypothetical protein